MHADAGYVHPSTAPMTKSPRWTAADIAKLPARMRGQTATLSKTEAVAVPKPSKYRSKRCIIDNLEFASLKEGRRYVELKNMQQAGLIGGLCMQVPIDCIVNDTTVCQYLADFSYHNRAPDGRLAEVVYEDVKGMRTDIYKLKRKLVAACTGIQITET